MPIAPFRFPPSLRLSTVVQTTIHSTFGSVPLSHTISLLLPCITACHGWQRFRSMLPCVAFWSEVSLPSAKPARFCTTRCSQGICFSIVMFLAATADRSGSRTDHPSQ